MYAKKLVWAYLNSWNDLDDENVDLYILNEIIARVVVSCWSSLSGTEYPLLYCICLHTIIFHGNVVVSAALDLDKRISTSDVCIYNIKRARLDWYPDT